MAPGMHVYSADLGSCSQSVTDQLRVELGTSMSVPIISGSLALIRQYFVEGFFPNGYRTEGHGFSPSGALLKAVVVAGGVKMTGYMDRGTSSGDFSYTYDRVDTSYPNNIQGYGRFQVSNVLKFVNRSNFELLIGGVSNGKYTAPQFESIDEVHHYRLCILGDKSPVKIAVVWMDYPAEVGASKALVNDLDLYVTRTNQNGDVVGVIYGNHGSQRDSVNNVEIVYQSSVAFGETWDVYVSASSLPMPSQKYAIVVTGQLTSTSNTAQCNFSESWKNRGGDLILEDPDFSSQSSWFETYKTYIIITACVTALVLILWACNYLRPRKEPEQKIVLGVRVPDHLYDDHIYPHYHYGK